MSSVLPKVLRQIPAVSSLLRTQVQGSIRGVKIYTKTGDKGTSGLYTGERRPKDDVIFEALGANDELTSTIGLAAEFCRESHLPFTSDLEDIQCVLQDVSSCIATPLSSARDAHLKNIQFDKENIRVLETWIDQYSLELPKLDKFILPSGGKSSASLHLARAVCRRVERRTVPLLKNNELASEPYQYLNRLSDYLFTVARYAAKMEGRRELIYTKRILESHEVTVEKPDTQESESESRPDNIAEEKDAKT